METYGELLTEMEKLVELLRLNVGGLKEEAEDNAAKNDFCDGIRQQSIELGYLTIRYETLMRKETHAKAAEPPTRAI